MDRPALPRCFRKTARPLVETADEDEIRGAYILELYTKFVGKPLDPRCNGCVPGTRPPQLTR